MRILDYTTEDNGLPVPDERAQAALTALKGYNFSSKVVVEFDAAKAEELRDPTPEELVEHAGIRRHAKDASTDLCREVVDQQRIKLPADTEITNSINGQTVSYSSDAIDPYGKRRYAYSGGKSHILDGLRMLLLGRHMEPIEALINAPKPKRKAVLDRFGL